MKDRYPSEQRDRKATPASDASQGSYGGWGRSDPPATVSWIQRCWRDTVARGRIQYPTLIPAAGRHVSTGGSNRRGLR